MASERILLIEDDASIVAGLELNLSLEGYEVLTAQDGERALELARVKKPDAIVLDIMLPGMNGMEVLRRLRQRDPEIPVLILSALGNEADRVLGLQLGADDYIVKPFSLSELRARLNAALRRQRIHSSVRTIQGFGDVEVDFDRRIVTRASKGVTMTAREFDVLAFFLRNPDRVITREMLLHSVWKLDFVSRRTIDNFLLRLRAKLEPDPDRPRFFVTVRGVGYRFEPGGQAAAPA